MIEIGDLVREKGCNQVLRVIGYSSVTDQFQVQIDNNSIPIRFIDNSSLELIEKASGGDFGGPALIPERWPID